MAKRFKQLRKCDHCSYKHRSSLEVDICEQLLINKVKYSYETEALEFIQPEKVRQYTPDWVVITKSGKKIYIETKGYFEADDRQKHKMIKDSQPDVDIRFVFTNANKRITKTSKTTYGIWCEKNGYKYATKLIPTSWLEE